MLTRFEIEAVERELALLERIAKALESLAAKTDITQPCRLEIVDGDTQCPMCGRRLGKED